MPQNVKNVVTLIAPGGRSGLTENNVSDVKKKLETVGATIAGSEWLAKKQACDLFFIDCSIDQVNETLKDITKFDFIVQPVENRRKKLLVSDMDSTMITIECIDELADFAGIKDKIAAITERAMNGELDFEDSLRERVKLLAGLKENALQKVFDDRLAFTPGAVPLIKTMRKNGSYCLLVSGGFTFFTNRVRSELGFNEDYSNQLEISNGKLTGKVKEPILGKQAKLEALNRKTEQLNLNKEDTLAVGDGANDLPMLLAAGLGVAYHAKSSVKAQARAKIDVCDLTALLYAQGYHADEIVSR